MTALQPMLASIGTTADLDNPGWTYEPKLDGERALLHKNTTLTLTSRRGYNITPLYPEFHFIDAITATTAILDGEIIVYDHHGNPNFELIQKRMHTTTNALRRSKDYPATYVVFDILQKNNHDLTSLPLRTRQQILHETVRDAPHLQLIISTTQGHRLWSIARQRHLEGVMAKNPDSLYHPGERTKDWRKVKLHKTIDCVIVGYSTENRPLSSLALGLYINGSLHYCGNVGTGFSQSTLTLLLDKLQPLTIDAPPVDNPPLKKITWVNPKVVCEIQYLQLTSGLEFRAPVFLRLRTDKPPEDCTLEGELTVAR